MAEGKRSYVVDENGNRTAIMLPIEEYEELLENLEDLALIAQRRDEPTVPLDVVVEQYPSPEQLGGYTVDDHDHLLGLYEGIPLTEREDYGMVLPDKITLFQAPIEAFCSNDDEVVEEVRKTVVHEVAHHFGIDDHTLHDLGV